MLSVFAVALVLMAPGDGPKTRLAAPGVSFVNLDDKTGSFYLDYFAQQVALNPWMSVTTRAQVEAVIGMERQKQLLGCGDQSAECTAELAGALGVDLLIVGSLGKVGSGFLVNLTVVSAKDAQAVFVMSNRVKDEDALLDYLGAQAKALSEKYKPAAAKAAPVETPVVAETGVVGPARPKAWIVPTTLGALALAGAATTYAMANGHKTALTNGTFTFGSYDDVAAYRRQGQNLNAIALGLGASAVLSLGSAGALYAMPAGGSRKWIPAAASGVALVGGGVLYGLAMADLSRIKSGSGISDRQTLEDVRGSGEQKQSAGLTLLAAGVVGAAATGWLFATDSAPSASLSLLPLRGGAFAAVTFQVSP
ncbi:MAG: hypothetical protein ACJ790_07060 [Myxococcaceae bacterium]